MNIMPADHNWFIIYFSIKDYPLCHNIFKDVCQFIIVNGNLTIILFTLQQKKPFDMLKLNGAPIPKNTLRL